MNKLCTVVIVWVVSSAMSSAAPSPEIKYLIHEPASMLDLGLYKLRDAVSAFVNDDSRLAGIGLRLRVNVETYYDFDRDQIHIVVGAPVPPPFLMQSKPRQTCVELVKLIQTWMNSDRKWTQAFRHGGYATNERADGDVKAKLPGVIVIDAAVIPDLPARTESCSGTLTKPEVTH